MAGLLEVPHVASLADAADSCRDCFGSLASVDSGELSGVPGAVVPCICVPSFGASWECSDQSGVRCACWMARWPVNGGHTGVVPLAPEEFEDDSPLYRPCSIHPVVRAPLAVTR